jgi:hypothetical protein
MRVLLLRCVVALVGMLSLPGTHAVAGSPLSNDPTPLAVCQDTIRTATLRLADDVQRGVSACLTRGIECLVGPENEAVTCCDRAAGRCEGDLTKVAKARERFVTYVTRRRCAVVPLDDVLVGLGYDALAERCGLGEGGLGSLDALAECLARLTLSETSCLIGTAELPRSADALACLGLEERFAAATGADLATCAALTPPSPTPASTATPTPGATITATVIATTSATASNTPVATVTAVPSPTTTAVAPTGTRTATPGATVTVTITTTPVTTTTPVATITAVVTTTASSTPVATATPSRTATATPVPTTTPVVTATSNPTTTATRTTTPVPTTTATKTSTPLPTATATMTSTPLPVATATKTSTPVPTATATKTSTPLPTATRTSTPVPTATPASPCGNGVKDAGEDCDDGNTNDCDACPSNCKAAVECATPAPSATRVPQRVSLKLANGEPLTSGNFCLSYPAGKVGFPGTGGIPARISGFTGQTSLADFNNAAQVALLGRNALTEIAVNVNFDLCAGQTAPALSAFSCRVVSASNAGTTIDPANVQCSPVAQP